MKETFICFITFLLLTTLNAQVQGQSRLVSGTVTDADSKETLIGATVRVKGGTQGTITDLDGKYAIQCVPEDTLVFSYVGYLQQAHAVNQQTVLNVALHVDVESLDEVVVIGYGTVKKSDLTGAVTSVKGDELIKIPTASPEQALQGKLAGVRVTSNSGAPGSAPTVRIRGVGTFGNPDPIYVVDGVILDDISFLNTADIESIEVLKDASATAMYGSRGANGVIIVTTRLGKIGAKPQVNISSGYNLQTIQHYIEMLNATEFAQVVNQIIPGTFNNLELLENTDWQHEVYRKTAPLYEAQLSINGGSKQSRYYASIGYFSQDGIIPSSAYNRLSLKLNNEYNLTDHIRFGDHLAINRFNRQNAPNIVAATLRAWPTDPPFNSDGSFNANRGNGNPLASIAYTDNSDKGIRSVGNLYTDIDLFRNFTFRSSFGLDYENSQNESFTPVFYVSPQQQNTESRLSKTDYTKTDWLWENTLTYHLELDKHRVDAVAGYTAQESQWESLSGQGKNLLRDDIRYLSNSLTDIIISNNAYKKAMISYLFRVNYTLLDRYMFTTTFRRDGSSVFSQENRWGNFPSLAVGWRISEEPFFHSALFSNLKLRASWGIVGNDKIDTNERYTLINNTAGAVFGTNETFYPGSTYGTSGNPLIRWEEANQTDVGLEMGFKKNKLTAEIDYYHKLTKDILIDLPLPGHAGNGSFTFVKFNAADVLNQGIELSTSWKDHVGEFSYEIQVVGSTVRNKVVKMGEDTGADNFLLLGSLGNGQNVKRVAVGQPIGYFYGYRVEGVFQNTEELSTYPHLSSQGVGDFRYADINNDGMITTDDRTFIGSPIPDFTYGLTFSASYKGFDFSFQFQGEMGKDIYDGKDAIRAGQYNYETRILGAWDGEGTSNTEPRITAGGVNYSQSDWFIRNGSFVRLRNISIGYTLPDKLVSKAGLHSLRIGFEGTNVLTLTKYTGYTPEIGGGVSMDGIDTGIYPVTSVYGINLNVSF